MSFVGAPALSITGWAVADFAADAAGVFFAGRGVGAVVGRLAGPADLEFAFADAELSLGVSAEAIGPAPLASATPSPTATVAAAAREVSKAGFIEDSNGRANAMADAAATHTYQLG